ncbi:transposase, partial [Pseudomonas aeruginosa]|uniref:transposase n=1 Tax=Pseudomonas aeruginosa TaxID=287 RepID=UPI0010524E31
PPFRRWYGRTDTLSERQRQALAERGLRRYYQTAFDDGYVPRVMPYVWRIIWTVGGLMAVTAVLPTNTGRPAFDALVVFSTWYPIGVMLLVFASRPLGRLIRQRAQERRK